MAQAGGGGVVVKELLRLQGIIIAQVAGGARTTITARAQGIVVVPEPVRKVLKEDRGVPPGQARVRCL